METQEVSPLREEELHTESGRALNRLSRVVLGFPSLQTFKTHLDVFQSHLLYVNLPWQEGLDQISRGPFQL